MRITPTGPWIRSRSQVKLAQRMAKKSISNAPFLVFLSRQCQNEGNVHETFINTKIPFKRRTFLEQKVPRRFFRNLAASVGSKQAKRSDPREENKVEFLETQFHGEKLSFVHKKEYEHFFELFLSICVFHRRIFKLKTRNFGLENHYMMNARQPFFLLTDDIH